MTQTHIAHYINGALANGSSTRTQPVYNPATGAVARQVRLGNVQDVDSAVAAVSRAMFQIPLMGLSELNTASSRSRCWRVR